MAAKKLTLKFKLLHKDATLPIYAHRGDAAFDLCTIESATLKKGEYRIFKMGFAAEIPEGWFVSIRDRSSLAGKFGIHVLAGVIDSGYRGEWMTVLANFGRKSYKVQVGEKIAQGILQPSRQAKIIRVDKLSQTKRGEKGFGSTGKK